MVRGRLGLLRRRLLVSGELTLIPRFQPAYFFVFLRFSLLSGFSSVAEGCLGPLIVRWWINYWVSGCDVLPIRRTSRLILFWGCDRTSRGLGVALKRGLRGKRTP